MKALEILKQLRSQNCVCDKDNHEFDESINELDELMKPKSCSTCKHYENGRFIPSEKCEKCFFLDEELKDNYEPKDEA